MKLSLSKCIIFLAVVSGLLTACSTDEFMRTLNMKNCKYTYSSVDNLSVAGIKPAEGLTLVNTASLLNILSGTRSTVPMSFDLTLDVQNPNATEASFRGVHYKVNIDGLDFTEGDVKEPFNVAAGETKPLTIKVETDVAHMLKGEARDTSLNMLKNFVGMGDKESIVKVDLWPTFLVAGQNMQSPVSVPVEFKFGGSTK